MYRSHPKLLLNRSNVPHPIPMQINVPHRNLWWSYFPKINIDAISDKGRRRRCAHQQQQSHSSATINTASVNVNHNTPSAAEDLATPTSTSSCSGASSSSGSFSEMRKKLGTHRKSLKSRVKRMYSRSQTAVAAQTDRLLSMARRNYTNQSANEDGNPRINNNNVSVSTVASDAYITLAVSPSPSPPPLPDLPKRYLRDYSERDSGRNKCEQEVLGNNKGGRDSVCHSKFYDDEDDDGILK